MYAAKKEIKHESLAIPKTLPKIQNSGNHPERIKLVCDQKRHNDLDFPIWIVN